MRLSGVTEGQLPAIGHRTSHPGATSVNDPALYGTTIPGAGSSGPTGRPMDTRDPAADTCRASCYAKRQERVLKVRAGQPCIHPTEAGAENASPALCNGQFLWGGCQAKRPEVSILAPGLSSESVSMHATLTCRGKTILILFAHCPCGRPSAASNQHGARRPSWLLPHRTSAADPVRPRSATPEHDSAEIGVSLDGPLKPYPCFVHLLPAALPASLQQVCYYLLSGAVPA